MFWGKVVQGSALWALVFCSFFSQALVVSPSAKEVEFEYEAEFKSDALGLARDQASLQAMHLFGYMQNPEIVRAWSLDRRLFGIGAPAWEPLIEVRSIQEGTDGARLIRYHARGRMIMAKPVADGLAAVGLWRITLPFDLDNFYDPKCSQQTPPGPGSFWYFYNPFAKGCDYLREAPLARDVIVKISAVAAPEDLPANLDQFRESPDDDVFLIVGINGYDEGPKTKDDVGREGFEAMNEWFRDQGFSETVISRFRDRPVHQFDKVLRKNDGSFVKVRLLRLLAVTELAGDHVTFAKFLKKNIRAADVVIFGGHSGSGAEMQLSEIEARAGGRFDLDPDKKQLFFFDACSSYSYFRELFADRKNPGTMSVLSNGIESLFGYEVWQTKHLYRILFDVDNNSYTWNQIIERVETPLRGNTFLLNLYINE